MHRCKLKAGVGRKSLSLKKTQNKGNGENTLTSDISKFFQKTKSPDDCKKLNGSLESQPLAKRQRNDFNSSPGNPSFPVTASFQIQTTAESLDFVTSSEEFSDLDCNTNSSHTENYIDTNPLKCITKTKQASLNNTNFNNSNTCSKLASAVGQCDPSIAHSLLTNGINSPEPLGSPNDFIIPPTPSPVDASKSKCKESIFSLKNDGTSNCYAKRNYKRIKKPNISLNKKQDSSRFSTKKVQNSDMNGNLPVPDAVKEIISSVNETNCKVNGRAKIDKDLLIFSENAKTSKVEDLEGGNSLRNSLSKLSKKTFKLSKKVKKVEPGKLALSSTRLAHVDVVDKGGDSEILSGYGDLGNTVNSDLGMNTVDDLKREDIYPQVKSRRKLSLDKSTNLKTTSNDTLINETYKETENNESKVSISKDNIPTENTMIDMEKSLAKESENNVQDIFDVSMNSDDLCQLVNDVSWSPMDVKTFKGKQNKLVSPAKQYVRSRSVELNTLARDIIVQDAKESPVNTDIPKHGYRRFLVLEVYRREILDNSTAKKAGIEKVLRLFDESDNSEKYCQLRGEWERTEVEHGDIVNIIGEESKCSSYILDNENENYIVVYPDILVTPTSISASTKCLRRSILDKYFKTEGTNQVMFLGTLIHRIFEASLKNKDFDSKFVSQHATELLEQPANLIELYGLDITEDEVLTKVAEFAPFLAEWGTNYFKADPHPIHGLIDFKDGGLSKSVGDDRAALCVSEVLDIEECVWSPKFGLKGQIDSSVEVKINRNPNILKRNSSLNQASILPLELKTGKCYTKLGSVEHRAQVILYSLMMKERYDNTVDTGLLLYLKTGHMLGVPAYKHEKRALVMKRNELIRYLSHNGTRVVQNMPAMLQDQHVCKYCPQLNVCTLYHKSVEKGDSKTAGMRSLFDKSTSHLSPVHLKYFAHWNELIALESKAMQENANDCDIWCLSGTEREQLGYCFSKMRLVSCNVSEEQGRYLNKFRKEEIKSFKVCAADMHLVKGDYIVVSQDDGILALATGFLQEISDETISVLVDKDLTQSYHHKNSCESQRPLYRIDKAEISTGATIQWSNLAKLFFADSEEHAKLRRLIVDLESPIFSRENEAISNVSSSQVSGAWSSQLPSCSKTSPVKSSQDSTELNQILQDLNTDQRKAIRKVLTAQDYALILGCPGAGKTHTIACLVRALVSLGKSVLLTSYTHSAVDNILLKLTQSQVDFLRLGSIQKVHPDIQPYVVREAAKHIKTVKELKNFYESKLVVATTCLGVNHTIFKQKSFDYCIVDEASQITQPVCIGSLRHASIFVLVGDHYQLPPLVQSHKSRENGMDISLFKRLSECHPHAVVNLEYQYRMHKHIMLLSNTLIYENRLKCATQSISESLLELPNWNNLSAIINEMENQHPGKFSWLSEVLDPQYPVLFIDTDSLPASEVRSGHNVYNESEAELVATITHGLIKSGLHCDDIGVISPYRQQLKVIKQHLNVERDYDKHTGPRLNVEINTVDKYQGRDKLCVIVSLVRSNAGGHVGDLLRDWRRVNVAVTRAKRKLILIGSKQTLNHNMLFQELLTLLEKNSWIYKLPASAWHGLLPW